jgi:hypothetical protein
MNNDFKDICTFVGEKPPPKTKSDELFGTLSKFIAAWKASVKSYKEKSIRKEKSAKREAEKNAKSAMKAKLSADHIEGKGEPRASKPRGPPKSLQVARGVPPARGAPTEAMAKQPRPPPGVKAPPARGGRGPARGGRPPPSARAPPPGIRGGPPSGAPIARGAPKGRPPPRPPPQGLNARGPPGVKPRGPPPPRGATSGGVSLKFF